MESLIGASPLSDPRNDHLSIFTAIDSNWLPYAWMFIASVRERTTANITYTLLYNGDVQLGPFMDWAETSNVDLRPVRVDVSVAHVQGGILGSLPLPDTRASACSYWGRYCARLVFEKLPKRLIHADVDMLAIDDLAPLMNADLAGREVGAVGLPHADAAAAIGLPRGSYVNNGLLVFDTTRFDDLRCMQGMARALREKSLPFGPQCAFNLAMQGRVTMLPPIWNVQGELRAAHRSDARLIHFTGLVKPWHTLSADPLRGEVKRLLQRIGADSAWRPDASVARYARLLARQAKRLLRQG